MTCILKFQRAQLFCHLEDTDEGVFKAHEKISYCFREPLPLHLFKQLYYTINFDFFL